MRTYQLQIFLFISILATPILCFSFGAPDEACETLTPLSENPPNGHDATTQPVSTNPYELVLDTFLDPEDNTYYYIPGVTYTITLRASSPSVVFRGFLIQGRVVGSNPQRADGSFAPPGIGTSYIFHNCNATQSLQFPQTSGVTHSNSNNKTSISFQWTAPQVGSGAIEFAYTVVQTRTVFWANLRSMVLAEQSCIPPEFQTSQTSTYCTLTCPSLQIGDTATNSCIPLPDGFEVITNATNYHISFEQDTPIGTFVLNYTAYINETAFQPIVGVFLTISQNINIESFFQFDLDEGREKQYPFPLPFETASPGILSTQEFISLRSRVPDDMFSNTNNEAIFQFNLATLVFGDGITEQYDATVFITVARPSDPCNVEPCLNGGTCNGSAADQTFSCECHPAYTGATCETLIDLCALDFCENGATCTNSFNCVCSPGFTGPTCNIDQEFCTNTSCMNGGTCMDLPGTNISCMCPPGFSGMICQTDEEFCASNPTFTCMNGGSCVEGVGNLTSCNCAAGYSGDSCELDLEFCITNPTFNCTNGGTCIEGPGTATSCNCLMGFSGDSCENDGEFCETNPTFNCTNGGTCVEGQGTSTICECANGFSGDSCEIDEEFCDSNLTFNCTNGGTCIEGLGTATSCDCLPGFSGNSCEFDEEFCLTNATFNCMNRGMCVEGVGTTTSCNCTAGFAGDDCSIDLDFCDTNPTFNCVNGKCEEGLGTLTSCKCFFGWGGDDCSIDQDFCGTPIQSFDCMNGGTCQEGLGNLTFCNCTAGYNGDSCQSDMDVCSNDSCSNNGACIEGDGASFTCNCSPGFSGNQCHVIMNNIIVPIVVILSIFTIVLILSIAVFAYRRRRSGAHNVQPLEMEIHK